MRQLCAAAVSSLVVLTSAHAGSLFPAWRNLYDNDPDGGQNRSQYARGVAVDSHGSVAVCGYIVDAAGRNSLWVAKYSGIDGRTPVWNPRTFPAPAYPGNPTPGAYATAVALDSKGDVIVTGYYQTTNGFDYITFKLSGTDGTVLWSMVYNNAANGGSDQALKVVVDHADNVIVTGKSAGSGTAYDVYTVKYDGMTGGVAWENRYNHPGNRDDIPSQITVDLSNNVYISGLADRAGSDSFFLMKLNSAGALQWGGVKLDPNGGYGATGLAVDPAGNAFIAGPVYNGGNYDIRTIKYNTSGGVAWTRQAATQTPENRWCGAAVDSVGNVSVVGTSAVDVNGQRMYTVRYAADGTFQWDTYSPGPTKFPNDTPQNLIVDGSSNTIVIGEVTSDDKQGNLQQGLYIGTYSPFDGKPSDETILNDLSPRFEERIDTIDYTPQMAFDPLGGMALVANYQKPKDSGPFFVGFSAIKFNRFVLRTGEEIAGTGLADNSKISALGSPAVSDGGDVAARLTAASKKGKLSAIAFVGVTGDPLLPAVQNQDAPGTEGKYKSFLDPILSPTGKIAFISKLSGVSGPESLAVFSNVKGGSVTAVLQTGKEISGLTGTVLKSVSSIGLNSANDGVGGTADDELIVVGKISGEVGGNAVTKADDTVLLGITSQSTKILLRTGQDFTADTETAKIKSFTVLSPTKTSGGQGRSESVNRVVALLTLDDKRTAICSVTEAGVAGNVIATGGDASLVKSGAKYKSFGFPAVSPDFVGASQTGIASLVSLAPSSDVKANADTAIVYGVNSTLSTRVAVEGGDTPGLTGVKYAGFSDPVINSNGRIAFLATLSGKTVSGATKTALMFGTPGAPQVKVRQGDTAPDEGAFETAQKFTGFVSIALPDGTNAQPIFLAKVAGKGVNSKNNLGLWGIDSYGHLRQLLRTGDALGGKIVTKISLLQTLPSVSGATRSFNGKGSVVALVSLKGGGSAIYPIGIP